jgi:ABC-type phosphate transport system permease subunit
MNSCRDTAVNARSIETTEFEKNLVRLYWTMRMVMVFIWLWTAFISWFSFPRAESLSWLRRTGVTSDTEFVLALACLFDLALGIASALFASPKMWLFQFVLTISYSIVIAVRLPEFIFHPFGPLTKNLAVFCCLANLIMMEGHRDRAIR